MMALLIGYTLGVRHVQHCFPPQPDLDHLARARGKGSGRDVGAVALDRVSAAMKNCP